MKSSVAAVRSSKQRNLLYRALLCSFKCKVQQTKFVLFCTVFMQCLEVLLLLRVVSDRQHIIKVMVVSCKEERSV